MKNNDGLNSEESNIELSQAELHGIEAGLDDIKHGRVIGHEEAMKQINAKFESLGIKR